MSTRGRTDEYFALREEKALSGRPALRAISLYELSTTFRPFSPVGSSCWTMENSISLSALL